MMGSRRSLAAFVEAACERAVHWWTAQQGRDLEESWAAEERLAARAAMRVWREELTRLCWEGDYWTLPPSMDTFDTLDDKPPTAELMEADEIAERIDCFLAALEREGTARQLARDCRADLDLLPVLADWCEDAGLPRASAEARHLHGLVRSYRLLP